MSTLSMFKIDDPIALVQSFIKRGKIKITRPGEDPRRVANRECMRRRRAAFVAAGLTTNGKKYQRSPNRKGVK